MFRSFLFDFVHQLSSSASLSLSDLSFAAKFTSKYVEYRTLMLCYFSIVYDDDHINYVATVLGWKLHIKE